MRCANCNQEVPEGTTVCPYCGAPAAQAGPVVPVSAAPAPVMGMAPDMPGASGVSIASLVLGILGIVLVILAFVLSFTLGAAIVRQFGENPNVAQEEIMRLAQDPAFQSSMIGILICFGGSLLAALGGLILGIVGIAQEGRSPTRGGKAMAILGLVLSLLPLLCCVSFLCIGLIGRGAG